MELEVSTPLLLLPWLSLPSLLQVLSLLPLQTSIMTLPNNRLFKDRPNSEEVEVPQLLLADGGYSMLTKVELMIMLVPLKFLPGIYRLLGSP
jgi:hypothetical protein